MKSGVVLTVLLSLCFPLRVFSAETANIGGVVQTAHGQPVEGVEIMVKDPADRLRARAITNTRGQYILENLPLGPCRLMLNPLTTGFKGETVATNLGAKGLTVNWLVSPSAPAIAAASNPGPRSGPNPGLSDNQVVAIGTLGTAGVAGIVAGSLALSGAFHDPLEPATLVAIVEDAQGNPVQGANVSLTGSFGQCRTDASGRCTIRGLGRNRNFRLRVDPPPGSGLQGGETDILSGPNGSGARVRLSQNNPPQVDVNTGGVTPPPVSPSA